MVRFHDKPRSEQTSKAASLGRTKGIFVNSAGWCAHLCRRVDAQQTQRHQVSEQHMLPSQHMWDISCHHYSCWTVMFWCKMPVDLNSHFIIKRKNDRMRKGCHFPSSFTALQHQVIKDCQHTCFCSPASHLLFHWLNSAPNKSSHITSLFNADLWFITGKIQKTLSMTASFLYSRFLLFQCLRLLLLAFLYIKLMPEV